jgi:hypothetical protein
MGDDAGAKASMETAERMEAERREKGKMTLPGGKVTNVPGVIEADMRQAYGAALAKSNQELKNQLLAESREGMTQLQMIKNMRADMFKTDEKGNVVMDEKGEPVPRIAMGPFAALLAHGAALMKEAGAPNDLIQSLSGMKDASTTTEIDKLGTQLAGSLAADQINGSTTGGEWHTILTKGVPGVAMLPKAALHILYALEARAKYHQNRYQHLKGADPTVDWRDIVNEGDITTAPWFKHPDEEAPKPEAVPIPKSLQGRPRLGQAKDGRFVDYDTNEVFDASGKPIGKITK